MRAMRAGASGHSARIRRYASGGGVFCAPAASPFLKARDGLQDRTRSVTAVELQTDQFVPPVAAGPIGAGEDVDDRVTRETGAGAGLHGGHAHRFVRNEMPQHDESLEFAVEEFAQ